MPKHRISLTFLLALALLGGQWVLVTHSHHQESLDPDRHCQLCKHAVQFDAFAPAQPPVQPMLFLSEHRGEMPSYRLYGRLPRFHDSRAPPAPA